MRRNGFTSALLNLQEATITRLGFTGGVSLREIKGDVAPTGGDHRRPALVKHSFMGVVEISEMSHFFLILLNEFLYFFFPEAACRET